MFYDMFVTIIIILGTGLLLFAYLFEVISTLKDIEKNQRTLIKILSNINLDIRFMNIKDKDLEE